MNHGHCNVQDTILEVLAARRSAVRPDAVRTETILRELATLRTWVSNQRSRRRQGTLDPHRISRLDAAGFLWDKQASPPEQARITLSWPA
jgi:hypothetical protein